MDEKTRTELEAAAFRGLVAHLQKRTDVQNIDLMNLAGFCRNCLSKWYAAAARERNVPLTDEEARIAVYGMPYSEWKAKHQKEATPSSRRPSRTPSPCTPRSAATCRRSKGSLSLSRLRERERPAFRRTGR
ncbi:DUF1244 domain-containing protein [Azospirillum argentinense]|uniref:DUF1244 domain-containing protein n=1 Tax=Azospirillum brasilense TaxID=192 RepID=A0A4D8QDK8_AZOBR|nr:DUF1244 domain-containing protein [Azospirillum argentinense]